MSRVYRGSDRAPGRVLGLEASPLATAARSSVRCSAFFPRPLRDATLLSAQLRLVYAMTVRARARARGAQPVAKGVCEGLAFRVAAASKDAVTRQLDERMDRELGYVRQTVWVRLADGRENMAVTWAADINQTGAHYDKTPGGVRRDGAWPVQPAASSACHATRGTAASPMGLRLSCLHHCAAGLCGVRAPPQPRAARWLRTSSCRPSS